MIRVQNLCKRYGEQVVFDEAEFLMTPGERLGLVGRNGYGKTTLFRLLLGQEQADDGEIITPRGYRLGHLSQHLQFDQETILDEACLGLAEDAQDERYRAEAALMGLGFSREDLARPAREFSGGYQIRVNLARVLVEQPNLLLLDEPTNYLDITSLRWLRGFLRGWPNELMVITHDRKFLEGVCTHSMVVHRRRLRRLEGSVQKLFEQIALEEEVHESARVNDEKKRKQEERFIERFRSKASKASVVQSRIKQLAKRDRLEQLETERDLKFRFREAPFHATTMLTIEGLGFGYTPEQPLIEGLDLTLETGDRVAIIGPNGRGKTTLLELLAGELTPDAGSMRANPNTAVAYFGQTNIARLDERHTVEQELQLAQPELTRTEVRGLAGRLMFPGEAAAKPVEVLSGGERSRVLLGKLLVSPANLLLLDEPTNHLDVESVQGLLDAVDAFPGAVLLVTHDEAILERVATRLVVFDGGRVSVFEGGYTDFLERVGWQSEADASGRKERPRTQNKRSRRQRAAIVRERAAATADLRRKVERLEADIERLEGEVARHDQEMLDAAESGRNDDLARCAAEAKRKREAIDAAFDELETAHDELTTLRAGFDERLAELD